MRLGENIKSKRQALKLSQEYVADQLGISRQAVSKWETGQSEPTARNLMELAAIFEVRLSELVDPPIQAVLGVSLVFSIFLLPRLLPKTHGLNFLVSDVLSTGGIAILYLKYLKYWRHVWKQKG